MELGSLDPELEELADQRVGEAAFEPLGLEFDQWKEVLVLRDLFDPEGVIVFEPSLSYMLPDSFHVLGRVMD